MKSNILLLVVAATICTATEMVDFEGFKTCSIIGEEARCNLGIRQAQLEHAVECGDFGYATYFSRICSVNSNGHTCGLAGAYHPDFLQLLSNCVGVTDDCSTECRNLMTMLRDELGCCINAVYNYTGSFFAPVLAPAFNYSLWSTQCGVEPPADNCTGNLAFTLPADSKSTCDLSQIQTQILSEWCEPDPFNRLRAVLEEHDCQVFIDFQTDVCSLNENGEYCSSTIDHFTYHQAIVNNCNFSSDTCSSECRNYFEGFTRDHGCCVNANFNSTFAAVHGQNFDIIREEAKWIQCGVRTPPTDCKLPGDKGLNLKGSIFILVLSILMAFMGTKI